ncbi:MAG: FkbM family methyltransferase [Peptostreptococcaceae bacterium]|nr:FkbM family methyltransferase [Peptostreptococcaceae bacterium]
MSKIVEFLEKIFPISAHEHRSIYFEFENKTFERLSNIEEVCGNNIKVLDEGVKRANEEIKNYISTKISDVEENNYKTTCKKLEELSENYKFLLSNIDALSDSSQKKLDLLNYIKGIDDYNNALYFVGLEKEYYKNCFDGNFLNIDNFYKRILKLREGLDDKSLEAIALIINRLKFIYEHNYPVMNIFATYEQKKILELRDHFYSNVIQIDENVYCYKNYLLPRNHFEACVFYYRHFIDKIKNIEVLKNRDIIDAGGFIGDSALIFSPLTNRKVYSFEPSYENYNDMLKTIELNNLNNLIAENIALSDKNGKSKFNICCSASTFHINKSFDYTNEIEVDVITLDEYVEKNNLNVGLIKTDLEGAEQEFLRGAVNTIKKFRPILLISIYHNMDDFLDIKPMIEDWNLGYKFKILKPVDGNIMFETMLIAEVY